MLYNLHINQLAFSQFEKLDYRHCIVFDAVHKIFTTFNKIEKIYEQDQTWYWLSYDLLLSQIPLLKVGKDQLRILLKDLALYNLISINPNNQKHARTYFCLGSNAESIFRPLEKIQDPSGINSRPPIEKIQDYNKQDIITNKNIKKEKFDAENYLKSLNLDIDILDSLLGWLEIRKIKKIATSQRAIDLVLKDLNKENKQTQILMIENSIKKGYTGIFQLPQPTGKYSNQEQSYQAQSQVTQQAKQEEAQNYIRRTEAFEESDEDKRKHELEMQIQNAGVEKIKNELEAGTFDFSQVSSFARITIKNIPDITNKAQAIYGNLLSQARFDNT